MIRALHHTSDYGFSVKVLIVKKDVEGIHAIAKPLKFEKCDMGTLADQPTMEFDLTDKTEITTFILDWVKIAEHLLINLGQDFTKEREAILRHLEDMRTLALKNKK